MRVVVDIETTGLNPSKHEIVQVAIVPFNENYVPKGRFMFHMKPLRPETADLKALEINGLSLDGLKSQPTPAQVRSCLIDWKNELYPEEQLEVLGHNYFYDGTFIRLWLGDDIYNSIFHYRIRDTQILARALMDAGKLTGLKSSGLSQLAEYLKIESPHRHDAYGDALTTLEVYKYLTSQYLL